MSRNRTRANSERNARAVIGSVSPSPRKISMVRTFTRRDRGNGDSSWYLSTSSGRTPQRASSARAVSPTGPTTVDVLSSGRLDLGLGIGWMPEEFALTGASMPRRGARAEEYLRVLRALWADGVSRFDGEFYTVPPGRQEPKPVQRPGPPRSSSAACPAPRWSGRAGPPTAG